MKRAVVSNVSKKTKEKIIHEWKTRKLNSIPAIAKEFKLSQNIVNRIINDFLSTKNKFI